MPRPFRGEPFTDPTRPPPIPCKREPPSVPELEPEPAASPDPAIPGAPSTPPAPPARHPPSPPPHPGATDTTVALAGGLLRVMVEDADLPLENLCAFASRRNPKRPFLFVSRVLGRHLPVAPATMRMVHRRLAAKVASATPTDGPVLVIGLAETAVALGQGVQEALRRLTGRDDILFLHSTRYALDHPLLGRFEERHSHATGHLLHRPADPADAALLAACRTLVLVDDEASTGATFAALTDSLAPELPSLARILCVTITDWMGPERRQALEAALPRPARCLSLLQGGYEFQAAKNTPPPVLPNVTGRGDRKDALLPANWGRLGRRAPAPLPPHIAALAPCHPGERILVLGTGEFVYPPFQLARLLSARGARVHVQATTRSPILVGGAITSCLEFPDAYRDGIPNFVYGVTPKQYDRILVCYETPPETAQESVLEALSATPLFFSHPEG